MLPTVSLDPKAALEAAASYSQTLTGWALLVLGGSVLALLQRAYMRPESKAIRSAYLLFVVGWSLLARSIFYGTRVQEARLGFLFQTKPDFIVSRKALNSDLLLQVRNLEYGLLVFGLWLAIYTAWWIFTRQNLESKG